MLATVRSRGKPHTYCRQTEKGNKCIRLHTQLLIPLCPSHTMSCSLARQYNRLFLSKQLRCFSTINMIVPPSKLVHGLTLERIQQDPVVEEYVRANFPGALDGEDFNSSVANLKDSDYKKQKEEMRSFRYPRNIRPLVAYVRKEGAEEGSRNSYRMRKNEMIPGILYGSDPTLGIYSHQPESKILVKTPWNEIQRELSRYHHHFAAKVYSLTLFEDEQDEQGTVHTVIPRNVQRHPVRDSIYCTNFLRYHAGRPIKLPVEYINQEDSIALKREGFVLKLHRYVECFIEEGADIPDVLEIDCTGLLFKESIHQHRILLPDGVRLSNHVIRQGKEFVIGVVFGKGKGANE